MGRRGRGRSREGPEKRRERPPLPTAAAFAGARCDLARFHKDGIGAGFPEMNIVCVSWKKIRSVIREGGASAAAAGKRLDRYSFASLAHSSFGGESWVAVATDAWKGVPRRKRPEQDEGREPDQFWRWT